MEENHEIGAYEAKTKLPEYLRKGVAGERFTITQRGQPVAQLVPADAARRGDTVAAARRMRAFVSALMTRPHGVVADRFLGSAP